jgi:uncharacterized delta-60 repeat protein
MRNQLSAVRFRVLLALLGICLIVGVFLHYTQPTSSQQKEISDGITSSKDGPIPEAPAVDGDLDATFTGTPGDATVPNGVARTFFGADSLASNDAVNSLGIQSTGKIVVAGISQTTVGTIARFSVARYNSDGTPDNSFDTDGRLQVPTFDAAVSAGESLADMVIGPGDKIIMIGRMFYNTSGGSPGNPCPVGDGPGPAAMAVAVYNADGTPDNTFDGDGKRLVNNFFGNPARDCGNNPVAVAVQGDGKIVIIGLTYETGPPPFYQPGFPRFYTVLLRLNTDGSLDNTFGGGDGVELFNSATFPLVLTDMAFIPSGPQAGKFLTVGGNGTAFQVNRFTSVGALDTSFDGDGTVTTTIGSGSPFANTIKLYNDGTNRFLVAGQTGGPTSQDFGMIRYSSDGVVDTAGFGASGRVLTDFSDATVTYQDTAKNVGIMADGRIVISGHSGGSNFTNNMGMARYSTAGVLDPTFGTAGKVVGHFGSNPVSIPPNVDHSVTPGTGGLQPDGKILVAGGINTSTQNDADFFVARFQNAPAGPAPPNQLIISEFRVRGPSGANDEFIEIFNRSLSPHTVAAASGTGYGVAASDGTTRCSVPNGTIIPGGGHYLCTNSVAYSLGGYATGDTTYATDIPDNAGIALFNNNTGGGSYTLANRLDAVGSTTEANVLYKEGAGYTALTPFSIDYSLTRLASGLASGASDDPTFPNTSFGRDTNNNATDLILVDTNGTSTGGQQRLGAPGPENLASPLIHISGFTRSLPDPCFVGNLPPNSIRDLTSVPAQNSTFGTVEVRRKFTNVTGVPITRLRFRVVKLTTFPSPSGTADLRTRTTANTTDNFSNLPCGTGTSVQTVLGTTTEQPPSQPNGGGWDTTFSVGTVTAGTPIPPGGSVIVRFLFGVQQTGAIPTGSIRGSMAIEALPRGGGLWSFQGSTETPIAGVTDVNNPTAAQVSIGGRVLTADGRGLTNARVTITGPDGVARTTITSSFGYYSFDGVESGATYVVAVGSKRYIFTPRTVQVVDNVADLDFVAEP